MGNFVFVFNVAVRDKLLESGFQMISGDQNRFLFINSPQLSFDWDGVEHLFTDVLYL